MGLEFRNPIVAGEELAITSIRSQDYVANTRGWRIGRDGSIQADNLQVLTNVGASGDINAESFHVGASGLFLADDTNVGTSLAGLETAVLNPDNVLAWGSLKNVGGSVAGAELVVMELQWVQPYTAVMGIYYRLMGTSNTAGDQLFGRLRYTTNGLLPGLASTILDQVDLGHVSTANRWVAGDAIFIGLFTAGVTYRIALTLLRAAGGGTISCPNGDHAQTMAAIKLSRTMTTASGLINRITTPSPAGPVGGAQTYTKTYLATWTDSYGPTNAKFDSTYCWQGNVSEYGGQTKSLIGFDYAQIYSDLSGAFSISSLKLTYKVRDSYYSDGTDFRIRWHNFTSSPATWLNANISSPPADIIKTNQLQGSTYTHTLDNSFASYLLASNMKGIAIGPATSTALDYWGNLWGYPWSTRPYLTVSYQK